jgi:Fur family ferric uptake transcriptional regulator
MVAIRGGRPAQKTINGLRAALKRSHIRWNPQREHIVNVLLSREQATIRELDAALRRRGHRIAPATIYRMMRILCEVGFAQPNGTAFHEGKPGMGSYPKQL